MTALPGSRFAAIDIGTNSVLLLVVEVTGSGIVRPNVLRPNNLWPNNLVPLLERAEITRLGEGVDRTGRLSEAACQRTLQVLTSYADQIKAYGVSAVRAVATSAMRDAAEGAAFLDAAQAVLGVRPEVISGHLEAELTFDGALSGLTLSGPVQVFDVGGGSTEIIQGTVYPSEVEPSASAAADRAYSIESAVSLDIGSVRLYERCLRSDPASVGDLTTLREVIRKALTTAPPPRPGAVLLGVAGTVTTLLALELGLTDYDAGRVHGGVMSHLALFALAERLEKLDLNARRAIPGLSPGRADVIVAGAAITVEVMKWSGAQEMVVSDRGVRWGVVQRLAATYA